MSSLVFGVICLYFDFVAYRDFKQIAYEIYMEENADNFELRDNRDTRDNRDNRERF